MNSKLANTHKFLATPKTGDGRIYFHPIFMMHAARQYGKTYSEFMQDYRVLVDSNMKLLEMYDHDAVSVISDSYREASAFGAKITFDGDSSPKVDKWFIKLVFNIVKKNYSLSFPMLQSDLNKVPFH